MRLTDDIVLPPAFTLIRLREVGNAFSHAMATASEHGAGTLIYVGRFDLIEFALILEPNEPLRLARCAFYAGMTALSEALIAQAQPETAVTIDWPDAIRINGGFVGGGRLSWPQDAGENDVPAWLIFGAVIRTVSMTDIEPGLNPLVTTLENEGFTSALSNNVVESFARHFMLAVDTWQEGGIAPVVQRYLDRLPKQKGVHHEISEEGDLLVHKIGQAESERRRLVPRLVQPSWLDQLLK